MSVQAWKSVQILNSLFSRLYVDDVTVTGHDVNARKYPYCVQESNT
jgi:hypothetical protein